MRDFLLDEKPSKVYITGGTAVISENVKNEIISLLPQVSVERLAGQDRFDTNAAIAQTFNPNPSTIYLATGYGFADALAGSTIAGKAGDPIIFVDPGTQILPSTVADYSKGLYTKDVSPKLIAFGGCSVVSEAVIKNVNNLLTGKAQEVPVLVNPLPSGNDSGAHKYTRISEKLYTKYYIDGKWVATGPNYNGSLDAFINGNGWSLKFYKTETLWGYNPFSHMPIYDTKFYPERLYINAVPTYNLKENTWRQDPNLDSMAKLAIEYVMNDLARMSQ
jgi:hypothetical protein